MNPRSHRPNSAHAPQRTRRPGLGRLLSAAPLALALSAAALLAACNDDDSSSFATTPTPVIVATADSFTLAAGQSGSLLANDTIGGAPATAGTGGNVVISLTTAMFPAVVTVAVSTGQVTVVSGAAPGNYSVGYTICDTLRPANCATTTAQVTVPRPTIAAAADTFTLAIGSSGDVLANDSLGGVPATAANVVVSATTAPLPAGVTLSAGGVLAVGAGAVAGTSTVAYQICQTTVPTNCATANVTLTVPSSGMVSGRAVDSATALGIAGVRVAAGNATATTGSDGGFTLNGVVPGSRVTLVFSADNYAETARVASVAATGTGTGIGTTDVQARLVAVAASADVAVDTGGTVTIANSPGRVVLAANSVQRADGSIPTGNVRVRVTPIDPASDTSVMPGDFTTLVAGAATPIESFGAMDIRLTDASGAALNLRSGQTASLRIPLSSRSASPPATIPMFWFDNASGRWVQEGTATLAGSGSSRYYEGTVSHFTVWNADQVSNTVRVSGCVADVNGVRVPGATVASDGIDYSGTSSATTDASGNFSLPIRLGSQATLVGLSAGQLTNTLRVGPYSADTAVTPCLQLGQTGAGITMKLTWGAQPSDLDSHLITPAGDHVYYASKGSLLSVPFANLDVDDTSSYGPEVITITKAMVGTYKYYIYNYSSFGGGSISNASARVELNVPGRAAELFTPPTVAEPSSTRVWTLFELDVDAQCTVTVRRVPAFAASEPSVPASTTPQYCVRP